MSRSAEVGREGGRCDIVRCSSGRPPPFKMSRRTGQLSSIYVSSPSKGSGRLYPSPMRLLDDDNQTNIDSKRRY